jgi:hypothetical protein
MDEISSALKKNPKSPWCHMEKEINGWCCNSIICMWVASKKGFKVYVEQIIPLLSNVQQKKHLDFGMHFHSNWGLLGGRMYKRSYHHSEEMITSVALTACRSAYSQRT